MGKYKTKAIQADLGIFRHIQAYSARHNQAYSAIFRTLCNPDMFRTLANSEPDAYSEPWQIQNHTHIQNLGIFRNLAYSEPWFVQNPGIFRTRGIFMTLIHSKPKHIQNDSLFRTPEHFGEIVNILYEINTMNVFNTGVIFTSIVFIVCRKSMRAQWTGDHEF